MNFIFVVGIGAGAICLWDIPLRSFRICNQKLVFTCESKNNVLH